MEQGFGSMVLEGQYVPNGQEIGVVVFTVEQYWEGGHEIGETLDCGQ